MEARKKNRMHLSYRKQTVFIAGLVLMICLSMVIYAANWFGFRDLLLTFLNKASFIEESDNTIGLSEYQGSEEWNKLAKNNNFTAPTPVVKSQSNVTNSGGAVEIDEAVVEYDADARQIYAETLRNLLYSNILPDGSTVEALAGQYSSFAVSDVDSDGKEELVILYDPGVMAGEIGYIIGYDSNTGEIYIQLEEFPYFAFLKNGNLKALSSHNQTYGDMWPYSFYQYIPESDTYELAGYVYSEDKRVLELSGMSEQYPYETDISEAGTVYYVGKDGWGTKPMDEMDYMEWLNENEGNVKELEIPYLSFSEENIEKIER